MNNERTSKRVASIAAKILRRVKCCQSSTCLYDSGLQRTKDGRPHTHKNPLICSIADLKALAASVLTQSPDQPKVSKKK